MPDTPIDPARAVQAVEEALRAYPKFAAMKPRLERVQLFKGSMLAVRFEQDGRTQGDPDNFMFEKLVVKTYRGLMGETAQ